MRLHNLAAGLAKVVGHSKVVGGPGGQNLRRPAATSRGKTPPLALERLEDRQLLSVSGRVFEDLNVNGMVDGGEPGFAGITIELYSDADDDNVFEPGGPDLLVASMLTQPSGAYLFPIEMAGRYFVRPQLPEGAMLTTSPAVHSVVAVPTQEIRDVDFGIAFEGSIHGFKFEDLDVDGVHDAGEPPLPGVQIVLSWIDAQGQAQTQSTTTDANGEYWFSWLKPGLTYTVKEVVPDGTIPTTPDPEAVFIGSGVEFVATEAQGGRVQRAVSFPWWWTIEIDPVPMGGVDPAPESIMVQGMATIEFSEAVNQAGETFPIVNRDNGLPLPLPDGQWTVETEITMLSLTGEDSQGRTVEVRLNDNLPSTGTIQAIGDPGVNGITGDSFFDIFVEIEIDDDSSDAPMILRTLEPVQVGMSFTADNPEPVPTILPRTDIRWMPTFFWREGVAQDLLDEAGNLWDVWISVHAMPHVEVEKPVRPVVVPTLAFGNAFEGSIHGFKFEDFDGDGERDANEPPLAGVTIVLLDANGETIETTTTDAGGEYWFKWLPPGQTFSVQEVPPVGSEQTTENPPPIVIGSGQEYVATEAQGFRVQRSVTFPWWVTFEIVPVGQTDPVSVMVAGEPTFNFSNLFNPETNEIIPLVDPDTGLPAVIPQGGEWTLRFEVTGAELRGVDPVTGGMAILHVSGKGDIQVSNVGLTAEDGFLVGTVDSFFDITVEIQRPGNQPPMLLRPDREIRFRTEFTREDRIPSRDVRWLPTIFWETGLGRDLLDDAGQLWDVLISLHAEPHAEMEKPVRTVIVPELAFGNTFQLSSIHGYKFEDLNVNGIDDGEPRIGGVTVTLEGDVDGDGAADRIVTTTNGNGEYWFTGIVPGTYKVSETPIFGSIPTTPTEFTVTVAPGEELVALPGQAMLNPGDTRSEVVVGPELAFGNAFEGSIHGVKFVDRNGDGARQPEEPPFPGVTIVLTGDNGAMETTITDENGEFWFTWLEPGVVYKVREVALPGSERTTDDIPPIFIGSGQEYVATQGQGNRAQRVVTFPWWWDIEIVPVGQQDPVVVMAEGTATLAFSDLTDVQTGNTSPIVNADDGLPNAVPGGSRWQVDFELVELNLAAVDPVTGGQLTVGGTGEGTMVVSSIQLDERTGGVLAGEVTANLDLNFQITTLGPAGGMQTMTLRPDEPVTIVQSFQPADEIPDTDVRWLPTFIWEEGLGRDLLDDAGELWDRWISIHAIPHVEVEKPVRPVVDPSLIIGNTPPVATAVLFYNNSVFDGFDPAANDADFNALATDKAALAVGETATFANISGYDKGINGVLIEVSQLPADGANITAADFDLRHGRTDNVNDWEPAPTPEVTVIPNSGPGNADRVLLVFADGSVRDTYLAVQMLANANTGFSQTQTFIFGNVVGETGASFIGQGQFFGRDAADLQRMARSLFVQAGPTSPTDVNKSGRTDAFDLQIVPVASTLASGGAFQSNVLPAITPALAAAAVPAPAVVVDEALAEGTGFAIASAQTLPAALLALGESGSAASRSKSARDDYFGRLGETGKQSERYYVPVSRPVELRPPAGSPDKPLDVTGRCDGSAPTALQSAWHDQLLEQFAAL